MGSGRGVRGLVGDPGLEQTAAAESSGEEAIHGADDGGVDSEKPVLALAGAETPF